MRIVITGGAGFLGSHLSEALLNRGDSVVCLDDLSTGQLGNIEPFLDNPRFEFVEVDVSEKIPVSGSVDAIAHLASAASPPDYHRMPLETLAVGSRGTENALKLALAQGARFVLASTSEIYGEPAVHPQTEEYYGNVNSIGPRSVYDEAKRFAEAISMAYARTFQANVGIVRIFNTFGPRMRPGDGRVVSSFMAQALNGRPLTIYGDGSQTRSFCYVDDLVRGLVAMIDSDDTGPINLGNPVERRVDELARLVLEITGSDSAIEFHPLPVDDPTRRRPDITRALERLGWRPEVDTREGIRRTLDWLVSQQQQVKEAAAILSGGQFQGSAPHLGLTKPVITIDGADPETALETDAA
jgi:dTDP-glucose 4,6-dehydratase